ncbi:hypothetical protein ACEXQB_004550 [Herbiconiux sp. P18]|uniref:hypothetical protein n=1 Tax=Herbiconiux liangxiaofengii TaxID=3342795 RepID=UPI0035BA3CE8
MAHELEQVAAELYALSPAEFTAARNARAAEATASGDRELAAGIRGLAKPSVAAWAVNALVRHRGDDVSALLDVGERMRDATESHDRESMRQLGRDRQQLLAAAARAARGLGEELGVAVSESAAVEVQQTLQAAVVDASAAAAVRSGLLVRTFESSGLDPVDLAGAVAIPDAAPRPAAEGTSAAAAPGDASGDGRSPMSRGVSGEAKRSAVDRERDAAERVARAAAERAERALAAAKRDAEEARQDADDADAAVATLDLRIRENRARHEQLATEQQHLRERLEQVQADLTDTNVTAARLRRERSAAARAADSSRRAATRARTRLDGLQD